MFPFYSVLCIIAASSSVYLLAVSGLLFVYLDSMAQYAGSGLKLIVSADTRCSVMSTSTRCIQYTLWCQQILLPGRSAGLHGFRAATLFLPPNRSSLFACLAIGRSTISKRLREIGIGGGVQGLQPKRYIRHSATLSQGHMNIQHNSTSYRECLKTVKTIPLHIPVLHANVRKLLKQYPCTYL